MKSGEEKQKQKVKLLLSTMEQATQGKAGPRLSGQRTVRGGMQRVQNPEPHRDSRGHRCYLWEEQVFPKRELWLGRECKAVLLTTSDQD